MNIATYIPASWRKPIYAVFAVIGVAIGSVQVGYAAAEVGNPTWLNVALAVFPFVATAIGFTAASNTTKPEDEIDWSGGSMADYAAADPELED